MSKNLVLSAAIGYKFNQVELFIKSLRKFYYESVVFVIGLNDLELEQELKKFGCEIIKVKIDRKEIQFKRYEIFLKYLHNKEFKNVLLCDSRDIYFQANPFDFNYKGQINFFLEGQLIKNCPHNSNWILKTYGSSEYEKISNKIILCSGTVLGEKLKIQEYLNLITKNIFNFRYKKRLKYLLTFRTDPEGRGCDQGHANYLVHNSKINNLYLYTNNKGPVATALYLKKIFFDKKSYLVNELGEPYLLIHQYDKRWEEFKKPLESFRTNINI